jgi:UDP-N-acetylglucosamine 2-epimerase
MLITVVGNRPQMIKMAPVSQEILRRGLDEYIIHTRQHYDHDMSGVFFEQLGIPAPRRLLNIQGRSHGRMTGEMLIQLEEAFEELKPAGVLVYGDTNSTLAAVLAAVKMHIPVAHAEAGPRTGDMSMPEEVNRITADHLSRLLFCPDEDSVKNLARENITAGVHLTGDLMYDAFRRFAPQAASAGRLDAYVQKFGGNDFVFMTAHRPVNVDGRDALENLYGLLQAAPLGVLFAVHPRSKASMERHGLLEKFQALPRLVMTGPLNYLESMEAVLRSRFVLTDSGGLQKEACWGGKCAFLAQDVSPWPALAQSGWVSCIGSFDKKPQADLWTKMLAHKPGGDLGAFFGDGRSAAKIVQLLQDQRFF